MTDQLSDDLNGLSLSPTLQKCVSIIQNKSITLISAIEQISDLIRKEHNPYELWKCLVGLECPESKKNLIYRMLETDSNAKVTFGDYINQLELKDIPQFYEELQSKSDTSLQALLLIFPLIKTESKAKIVDIALDKLKYSKKKTTMKLELQTVSRFYIHLTKKDDLPAEYTRERTLSIISRYADRRLEHDLVSQVVMIIAKLCDLDYESTQKELTSVVEDYVLEDTNDSLIIAFSLTSLLFHINDSLGFAVFSIDVLLKQQFDQKHLLSEQVVTAALDLLSAACVNQESRAQVKANFLPVVKQALNSSKKSVVILAASILVKTNYVKELPGTEEKEKVDIPGLSLIFEDEIATGENIELKDIYGSALEGLAYTSLFPEVKKRIISNSSIVNSLVTVVSKYHSENPWVYCSLSTIANLTSYTPKLSSEQERLKKLKDYANRTQNEKDAFAEPDSIVSERCKKVLNSDLIDSLSQYCPSFTLASRNSVAIILRNLATEKSDRSSFAQKGGLTVLLYLVIPTDKPDQYGNKHRVDNKHLSIALSGLARTLISINPALALSSKLTPSVTVSPLILQLNNEFSDIPLLDTFEALLALTNVASVDDTCRNLIIRNGWAKIEMLLTSSNTMVQRSAIELLCNLAPSPLCAEKYLDGSQAANSRLDILAALTDLDDILARTAATGALAMLSEWGPATKVMTSSKRLKDRLLTIVQEETNSDVLIRALVAIQNLISDSSSVEFIKDLKSKGLEANLTKLVAKTKDSDIASISSEISKVLEQN